MLSLHLAYHDDSSFESEAKVKSLQCQVGEGPKRRLTDSLRTSSSTFMFLGGSFPPPLPMQIVELVTLLPF